MPEYIGYADQSLERDNFTALKPLIEITNPHRFKYGIDFDNLRVTPDIRALCVSRPTNPSGNLITDAEMKRLAELASRHDIPLLVDNAYGWPFPGILFDEVTPLWTGQTIHVMSLSKFGLPGTRTAFVVGPPEVAAAVASMTAVTGLANGNFGQAIAGPLISSGEITRLSRDIIRPHYLAKREKALAAIAEFFPDTAPYSLHESGGAMFLWLWVRDSKRTSKEIYRDLKKRGVLVVPGNTSSSVLRMSHGPIATNASASPSPWTTTMSAKASGSSRVNSSEVERGNRPADTKVTHSRGDLSMAAPYSPSLGSSSRAFSTSGSGRDFLGLTPSWTSFWA